MVEFNYCVLFCEKDFPLYDLTIINLSYIYFPPFYHPCLYTIRDHFKGKYLNAFDPYRALRAIANKIHNTIICKAGKDLLVT